MRGGGACVAGTRGNSSQSEGGAHPAVLEDAFTGHLKRPRLHDASRPGDDRWRRQRIMGPARHAECGAQGCRVSGRLCGLAHSFVLPGQVGSCTRARRLGLRVRLQDVGFSPDRVWRLPQIKLDSLTHTPSLPPFLPPSLTLSVSVCVFLPAVSTPAEGSSTKTHLVMTAEVRSSWP